MKGQKKAVLESQMAGKNNAVLDKKRGSRTTTKK